MHVDTSLLFFPTLQAITCMSALSQMDQSMGMLTLCSIKKLSTLLPPALWEKMALHMSYVMADLAVISAEVRKDREGE